MKSEQAIKILSEIAQLEVSGKYDEAMSQLRPWLDVAKPGPRIVAAYARLSVHFGEQQKAVSLVENSLKNYRLDSKLQSGLHFHAGDLYDQLNEYDMAFRHYSSANNVLPVQFNTHAYESFTAVQRQFFTHHSMINLARADIVGKRPVFIIGMPRSGTTLTEQILDRHTEIHGAGELASINEIISSLPQRFSLKAPYPFCLAELNSKQLNKLAELYQSTVSKNSKNAVCVTDKMPSNCAHLGLIELIQPFAKVIHCRRHPLDTCLSSYFQNFGNAHQYSRRLEYLAKMYRIYLDMVSMWEGVINLPVFELRYEKMVCDQENVSRRLIEFCGHEWEQQCLSFNESERDVNTCSYNQVRKPMYTTSVDRWRNYEKHIEPLITELEDVVEQYEI